MTALLYLLGFVCGVIAVLLVKLIIDAKRRKNEFANGIENSFNNILNY